MGSIVNCKNAKDILDKLYLLTDFIESFSNDKIILKKIKRVALIYRSRAKEKTFLMSENNRESIMYLAEGVTRLARAFARAKITDDYNRARRELEAYRKELADAVTKFDLEYATAKGRALFGTIVDKAKGIGDALNREIDKIARKEDTDSDGD
ncbi:MAG: hypothetical protein IJY01_07300 [Clostridia bacterium]|nr:hypothetical protein [Clostridia bacterium]MBQ8290656.1 hypothetical protein [Clostridia bacterium]